MYVNTIRNICYVITGNNVFRLIRHDSPQCFLFWYIALLLNDYVLHTNFCLYFYEVSLFLFAAFVWFMILFLTCLQVCTHCQWMVILVISCTQVITEYTDFCCLTKVTKVFSPNLLLLLIYSYTCQHTYNTYLYSHTQCL